MAVKKYRTKKIISKLLFGILVLVIIQSIRKMVARRKEKLASLEQLRSQQAA